MFSGIAKMQAEVKRRAKVIASISSIRTVSYKGFKIIEADAVDIEGRYFVMLGAKISKKASVKVKNITIAEALAVEITAAYSRIWQ